MSDGFDKAFERLKARLDGADLEGRARIEVADEGVILVDGAAVTKGDAVDGGEADVTLSADLDTFHALFDGDLDPTSAFMTGKLSVEGDMETALRLGQMLG